MKLMKKNTHMLTKKKDSYFLKFDWSKITEKNSSVHSEQLNDSNKIGSESGLNEILQVKKKIKEFESSHTKMVQMSLVVELMLDSAKLYYYSQSLLYFIIDNIGCFLSKTVDEIKEYLQVNKNLLSEG